ncbi:hypothetical protein L1987_61751 [Smallanthus sonchifolius]|uniref:Uncharacterized protein n=1 Tax=Smallanthus sonchifolius TaxID=185202 RepID=A0ACB9C8P0_9ASTR|nr:hypothetical protein L1987_61751 [Smallanthus sonchifolius]
MSFSPREHNDRSGLDDSQRFQPEISSENVVDRFAKMRLTPPSQSHVSGKSKKDGRFARTTPYRPPSPGTAEFPPPIPLLLYGRVKDAVDIMNRPGWRNGGDDECHLEEIEAKIDRISDIYSFCMPVGWK